MNYFIEKDTESGTVRILESDTDGFEGVVKEVPARYDIVINELEAVRASALLNRYVSGGKMNPNEIDEVKSYVRKVVAS